MSLHPCLLLSVSLSFFLTFSHLFSLSPYRYHISPSFSLSLYHPVLLSVFLYIIFFGVIVIHLSLSLSLFPERGTEFQFSHLAKTRPPPSNVTRLLSPCVLFSIPSVHDTLFLGSSRTCPSLSFWAVREQTQSLVPSLWADVGVVAAVLARPCSG